MGRRGDAVGFWLLAALCAAPEGARADSPLLEEAVGLSGIAMFQQSGATGMVLAVVQGDDDMVVGFGETAKDSGREPDGRTLLRIGSISKALAGELLGGLAAEGRLSLTDPLRSYAPEGARTRSGRARDHAA